MAVDAQAKPAELSEGARVEDLFAWYGRRFPELEAFRASVAASVNQEFAEYPWLPTPSAQLDYSGAVERPPHPLRPQQVSARY